MDHPHQRGLWFAHDHVNKLDFWNNEWSYFADMHRPNLGRINLKQAGEMKSGKTQGPSPPPSNGPIWKAIIRYSPNRA